MRDTKKLKTILASLKSDVGNTDKYKQHKPSLICI